MIGPYDPVKAQYRSQMKDGLIVLQGLLLGVCIGAYLLRRQNLVRIAFITLFLTQQKHMHHKENYDFSPPNNQT